MYLRTWLQSFEKYPPTDPDWRIPPGIDWRILRRWNSVGSWPSWIAHTLYCRLEVNQNKSNSKVIRDNKPNLTYWPSCTKTIRRMKALRRHPSARRCPTWPRRTTWARAVCPVHPSPSHLVQILGMATLFYILTSCGGRQIGRRWRKRTTKLKWTTSLYFVAETFSSRLTSLSYQTLCCRC